MLGNRTLMDRKPRFPLDLQRTTYSYIERHNSEILSLLRLHVLGARPDASVLDIGCGAGANGRALRALYPKLHMQGVEPNGRAATLARNVYDEVFEGYSSAFIEEAAKRSAIAKYDAVVLYYFILHFP